MKINIYIFNIYILNIYILKNKLIYIIYIYINLLEFHINLIEALQHNNHVPLTEQIKKKKDRPFFTPLSFFVYSPLLSLLTVSLSHQTTIFVHFSLSITQHKPFSFLSLPFIIRLSLSPTRRPKSYVSLYLSTTRRQHFRFSSFKNLPFAGDINEASSHIHTVSGSLLSFFFFL